jgi:single-strand DNA-binding protein
MKGMNRVIMVGNLGSDPEVKKLKEGIAVARISLAITEICRLRNGSVRSDTQWHTIVFWRYLAELAEKYLRKGSLIYVEGRLKTRTYEGSKGIKKFVTEIVGDKLILLDKKSPAKNETTLESLFDDPPPF